MKDTVTIQNIVSMIAPAIPTWRLYAQVPSEDQTEPYFADRVHMWVTIEELRPENDERYQSLFVGDAAYSRETDIEGIGLGELNNGGVSYCGKGDNFLGYEDEGLPATWPESTKNYWREKATKYLVKKP